MNLFFLTIMALCLVLVTLFFYVIYLITKLEKRILVNESLQSDASQLFITLGQSLSAFEQSQKDLGIIIGNQLDFAESLGERLAILETQNAIKPRVEDKPWHIILGGEQVAIKAFDPVAWVATMGDLPSFLFTYISSTKSGNVNEQDLQDLADKARPMIEASVLSPVDMNKVSVPEMLGAIKVIIEINGIDKSLAEFFKKKSQSSFLADSATDSPASPVN